MTRRAVVRIYQAPDGWRWNFSRNGRKRSNGGQGYSRHIDCRRGMWDSLAIQGTTDDGDLWRYVKDGGVEVIRLVDEGKP